MYDQLPIRGLLKVASNNANTIGISELWKQSLIRLYI